MSWQLRAATTADLAAIVALVQRAYRGESSRAGWTTEADLLDGQRTDPDEVAALLARPASAILLAERAGVLEGCAHVAREGDAGYFGMFAVEPTLQGGGLGSRILAEAERHARATWGVREMRMTVIDVRAELLAFYARRGYADTGERKPFPYGDPRCGLPRRADLRFAVLAKALSAAGA